MLMGMHNWLNGTAGCGATSAKATTAVLSDADTSADADGSSKIMLKPYSSVSHKRAKVVLEALETEVAPYLQKHYLDDDASDALALVCVPGVLQTIMSHCIDDVAPLPISPSPEKTVQYLALAEEPLHAAWFKETWDALIECDTLGIILSYITPPSLVRASVLDLHTIRSYIQTQQKPR
jgi:hypothetical protein